MPNLTCRYLLISLFCVLPMLSFAQTVYEGQVVDTITETPLQKATVSLLKAKQGTSTDNQGYFRIEVKDTISGDVLQISFVGYKTYQLPIAKYQPKMFIPLVPAENKLGQVNIKGRKIKTEVLDKFNIGDIKDIRIEKLTKNGPIAMGYFTDPFFRSGLFAKTFEAPQENVKLNTIEFGRRDLDIPALSENFPKATSSQHMRFLLHVILPDNVTGEPGKKIFTKEVSIDNNVLKITVDLKNDKITIPSKKFFIAIEWLPIPLNEVIKLNIENKADHIKKDGTQKLEETARYSLFYQPFLVKFVSGIGTYGWVSVDNKSWNKIDFRSPVPSPLHPNYNIALSATIVY